MHDLSCATTHHSFRVDDALYTAFVLADAGIRGRHLHENGSFDTKKNATALGGETQAERLEAAYQQTEQMQRGGKQRPWVPAC